MVCGLWFVVCGLWFVVCGSGLGVCGLWFVVCGLGSGVSNFRFRVSGFGFRGVGFTTMPHRATSAKPRLLASPAVPSDGWAMTSGRVFRRSVHFPWYQSRIAQFKDILCTDISTKFLAEIAIDAICVLAKGPFTRAVILRERE